MAEKYILASTATNVPQNSITAVLHFPMIDSPLWPGLTSKSLSHECGLACKMAGIWVSEGNLQVIEFWRSILSSDGRYSAMPPPRFLCLLERSIARTDSNPNPILLHLSRPANRAVSPEPYPPGPGARSVAHGTAMVTNLTWGYISNVGAALPKYLECSLIRTPYGDLARTKPLPPAWLS